MRQHVPWEDVLEVAKELHKTAADLIVTLGAGSLTDGAKVASFAVANEAFTTEDLARLHISASPKPDPSTIKGCELPIINIPTSLSGGEYTFSGGATDFRTHQKRSFQHPTIGASLIILDPAITISTPERVWLSSGLRAVDHCIEGLCSVFFNGPADADTKQKVEDSLIAGLKLLLPSLLITKQKPQDIPARQNCMLGVVEAMKGLKSGVPMGASHGIGHQLGPLGVGHGETTCVLLPSTLRWNQKYGEKWVHERQAKVLSVIQNNLNIVDTLQQAGFDSNSQDLGGAVAAYIAALGLPGSLREDGVGVDKLTGLAENAMTDRYIPTNPVTIRQTEQVEEILQMAMG
ncbi:putative Alcohol dehydrogenase iron-type/glycerol dehydrogenase GldA domain-containing protein [Seiridium cardinale]|uniref:Alcohol dehydrogenase iron-type/glycerol dehydrogenase GldA domain-containing protein n=1 Tax=Seiridium cardinale TaxID=138064 RepID=A0ABR2XL34_9PEZI